MRYLRAVLARIAGALTGQRADDELRDELQSHLDMAIAENVRRGMPPDEARRQAMLASGGLTVAAEAVRARRGLPWIESIVADTRFALRALRQAPAFAAVVVITLALGIGANTAIFSVVRGVLLKPLPHRDGDRLVYLRHSADGPGQENIGFSVPEIRDFRAGATALGGIAEYSPWTLTLQGDDAVRINVGLVTGNYFEVMGLSPLFGRLTRPSDDGSGVAPVIVLTHEFWTKRFGRDSSIVGKALRLDGTSATVIGVLQPAPFFPDRIDALLNMVISPHHVSATMVQGRTHRMTEMVARLAPGATVDEARAEVAAVDARAQNDFKDAYDPGSHYHVTVIPFKDALGERAQLTLWLLMAAAAFVMIISAANVANLTLMRGVRREHELVIRTALGAGRARLRRLLLVENLVLTFAGAAIGVLIAVGGVRLLTSLAERYSPRANEIGVDATVLGFTLGLSVAVALLLSFAATLPNEGSLASMISAGVHRISGGLRKHHLQRGLVVAQVAVSVVLLAGAGLLTRTTIRLAEVSTGLKTEQVLTMDVQLITLTQLASGTASDVDIKARYGRIRGELAGIPGVVDVGVGSTMPLQKTQLQFEFKAEGKTLAVGEAMPRADLRTADPDYFRAAGIPLAQGREFSTNDEPGSGRVVIVNQTFADRFFPRESAIGKRIAMTGDLLRFTPFSGDWRTVVGVVGNTQDGGLDAAPRPSVFMPFAQEMTIGGGLVIRADSNLSAVTAAATRIVHRIAPTALIEHVLTVSQIKDQSVAPRRLNAELISLFGSLAVLIAAVGIAGVLAFSVSARTNEIGIRMSLGADRGRVQRMVLKEGGVLVATGLVLGVAGALVATGVIRGLLFGVAPRDPVTLVGVAVLMGAIGLAACWIPARRAARIDPAIAMRST